MSNGKGGNSAFWEGFARSLSRSLGGYGERLWEEASQERRAKKEEAFQIRGERRREATAMRVAEKKADIGFDYDMKLAERKQRMQRDDIEWAKRYESSLDQYFGSPQIKERFLRASVDMATLPTLLEKQLVSLNMQAADSVLDKVRNREEIGSEEKEVLTGFLGNAAAPIFEKIAENKEWREMQHEKKLNWASDRAYKIKLGNYYDAQSEALESGKPFDMEKYMKDRGKVAKEKSDILSGTKYQELQANMPEGGYIEGDPEFEAWDSFQDRLRLIDELLTTMDDRVFKTFGIRIGQEGKARPGLEAPWGDRPPRHWTTDASTGERREQKVQGLGDITQMPVDEHGYKFGETKEDKEGKGWIYVGGDVWNPTGEEWTAADGKKYIVGESYTIAGQKYLCIGKDQFIPTD